MSGAEKEKALPRRYSCHRAEARIVVDGKLEDAAWQKAPWSDCFVDIEGDRKPAPAYRTRMKMLWDDTYLYVAAEIEEPHVWGTLTERNCVIFHDNDFEVFIDPDGDTENYHEFEMNALNTIWELDLPVRYSRGGKPINGTNLAGLKSAVHVDGTLNDPSDIDRGWSIEIAFPWVGLAPYNKGRSTPPGKGEVWRLNFSRVEWDLEIVEGQYRKIPDRPEHNWVWTPQGVIDMHQPETWGYVVFE